jgi:hypothetical protein
VRLEKTYFLSSQDINEVAFEADICGIFEIAGLVPASSSRYLGR